MRPIWASQENFPMQHVATLPHPFSWPAAGRLRLFGVGLTSLVLVMLAGILAPRVALADGSAGLYPTNATCQPNSAGGSCRANIEWRTSAYGPVGGTQVRRRSLFQVFVNAGETLFMGSSAVGVNSGDILIYNPGLVSDPSAEPLPTITSGTNGFKCSVQRAGSGIAGQGKITNRAQELAGPDTVPGGSIVGGYTPCTYTAPSAGIYYVVFYGPAGDGTDGDGGPTADIGLAAASNFDVSQGSSVAAWDVTVRSSLTSTTNLTGRLFTQALVAFTGGNGRPVNFSVWAVTADGYRYRIDTRGVDPNGFVFYGNPIGFLDNDHVTPLDHDAYGTTNSGQLTALAGGVDFAAPAYPIFFTSPSIPALGGLGIPATATAPVISSMNFSGGAGGNTSFIATGGSFHYASNIGGVYEIVISRDGANFDPGNAQNRVLCPRCWRPDR